MNGLGQQVAPNGGVDFLSKIHNSMVLSSLEKASAIGLSFF